MFMVVTILLSTLASSLAFNDPSSIILKGLDLHILSNGAFKVGAVTVPINTLCKNKEITAVLMCDICSIDCTSAHNLYGGQCAKDSEVCICNISKPSDGVVPTAEQHCGPLTLTHIPANLGGFSDDVLNLTIKLRAHVVLCNGTNGSGCNVDCVQNHQFDKGLCAIETPVKALGYTDNTKRQFCGCKFN